ncbi:MAG: hypothetical protein BAJATHORv1_30426 [Candidatus Thorarchaeota archaeon]|nr:MAG: hypothetical protein BAJATHORv1_30426 [Candidatus Thorarchaeota archaeon]
MPEENGDSELTDIPDLEAETKRLMEAAMKRSIGGSTETIPFPIPEETDEKEPDDSVTQEQEASIIDETFQRIEFRIVDILASIEDTVKATDPFVQEQVSTMMQSLKKKFQSMGLGVFATKAIKTVQDELETGLDPGKLLGPIYDTIQEGQESAKDILEKASRGAIRNVGRSTSSLQGKIIQLYARVNELDVQLEQERSSARRWRAKSKEMEERLRMKEEIIDEMESDMDRLRDLYSELSGQMEGRGHEISVLKGSLREAESELKQQKELIASLEDAKDITSDYEEKMKEVASLTGTISELEERIEQKDETIQTYQQQIAGLNEKVGELEWKIISMSDELSSKRGLNDTHEAELVALNKQIEELKARWDMLYQVAEDEPAFKAYFLIADKEYSWLPLQHISQALGVPTVLLKRNLQKFVDIGLVEIKDDKIRPKSIKDAIQETPDDSDGESKTDEVGEESDSSAEE